VACKKGESHIKERSESAALNCNYKFVFVEATVFRVDDVQLYMGVEV
jgi:hypothetical protein